MTTDAALILPLDDLPAGWVITGAHLDRWANIDLVYAPGPHHHFVRVWLSTRTAPVAPWLRPILAAIATAPVKIETHVWADRT